MSHSTPQVVNGFLRATEDAPLIRLGSEAWWAWLDEEAHCVFYFKHQTGCFTARKERRQRGQYYWVAYRQWQNKLHKTYLGKGATLSLDRLIAASRKLSATCKY